MKICHVIYTPRLSGAEVLVRDLTLAHTSLEHQVAILSIEPPETSFMNELERIKVAGTSLIFPKVKLKKLERLQFLCREIKKFAPDVILGHSVIPSAYARLALKLTGLKDTSMISVFHDASQDDYASSYLRFLEKWIVPSPNCIVALTQTAVDNYHRRIGNSIKTKIIPNGINLERLHHAQVNREEIRRNVFSVKDEELIFLQIGRLNSIKQQHLSLKAYFKACQNYNLQGKLFFVGLVEDRELDRKLKEIVADSGFKDRIIFLGARTDVPDLLAGADVYLMPSKHEAHSIAFIEALASGITIIASDISSFQYSLEFSGVTLLQPENIDLFAQEISKTIHLAGGKRWKRNLSDYSIEKTSRAYLEVFNFLTTSKRNVSTS